MNASERVTALANGISDGLNCLAQFRALRAEPPTASAAELNDWRDVLDRMQKSLEAIMAGEAVTDLRVSGDLVRCVESVRVRLSAVAPSAPLDASLFDLADAAWVELAKAMQPGDRQEIP
jgi:hypothetical protein